MLLGFLRLLVGRGPGSITLGIVTEEFAELQDFLIFLGYGVNELRIFHAEAIDNLFLTCETRFNKLKLFWICKSVLALDHFFKLLTETGAFLHVCAEFNLHLVLFSCLYVPLQRVKLPTLLGNDDLHLLDPSLQVQCEMTLKFLHLREVAAHHRKCRRGCRRTGGDICESVWLDQELINYAGTLPELGLQDCHARLELDVFITDGVVVQFLLQDVLIEDFTLLIHNLRT